MFNAIVRELKALVAADSYSLRLDGKWLLGFESEDAANKYYREHLVRSHYQSIQLYSATAAGVQSFMYAIR